MARTLPNDKTIESGIVGSLLRKPELVLSAEYVKQGMFYDDTLGILYKCVAELYDEGITDVDDATIITKVNESARYRRILNDKNITDIRVLFDNLRLIGTQNQDEYERRCRRLATLDFKRKTYLTLTDITDKIILDNDDEDINELNIDIQDKVMKLSETYLLTNDVELIGSQLDEIRKTINIKNVKGQGAGIPSKYPILKEYFSYEPGELIIIGGRAKSGKSIFFMNEVVHKLKQGCAILYLDTEMSTVQWVERFLAHWTGIKVKDIKQKSYDEDLELESKIEEAYEFLASAKFAHIYNPEWTQEQVLTTAKVFQRKVGLDLLVYDYIKMMNEGEANVKEHNLLGAWTNFLKNKVGGKLGVPVLAGGQMSPKENRLADSDKINRYASVIAYWSKKTPEEIKKDGINVGTHKLFVDYNRLGKQMFEHEYINMVFDGDTCTIQQSRSQNVDKDGF